MVRTLSFHLKNAGSTPASLNINYQTTYYIRKQQQHLFNLYNLKKFCYKFLFASLISPWMLNNLRMFIVYKTFFTDSRLYIKQSYLLLTWVYYLSFINEFGLLNQKRKKKY